MSGAFKRGKNQNGLREEKQNCVSISLERLKARNSRVGSREEDNSKWGEEGNL